MIFAVFDFETSGLTVHHDAPVDRQPHAIEFAGILTDGKEIIERLEFLINPEVMLEPIITKLTGLTDTDLEGQPMFGFYKDRLQEFFSKADAAISHNLSFDKAILRYELERIQLDLSYVHFPDLQICTVEQTFHQYGHRMKLETLYNMHCGEYVQTHRAMGDCEKLTELCKTIGVFNVFSAA